MKDRDWVKLFELVGRVEGELREELVEEIQELHSRYEPESKFVKGR